LLAFHAPVFSSGFNFWNYKIDAVPEYPREGQSVKLIVRDNPAIGCSSVVVNGVELDEGNRRFSLSLSPGALVPTTCPTFSSFTVDLGAVQQSGIYVVDVYHEPATEVPPAFAQNRFVNSFMVSVSPALETEKYQIAITPEVRTYAGELTLEFRRTEGANWCTFGTNAIQVDHYNQIYKVSIFSNTFSFTGCPGTNPARVPLGSPPGDGEYTLEIFEEVLGSEAETLFDGANRILATGFVVTRPVDEALAEVPAQGSTQSGVGVIRGWACDARSVEIQIDELPPMQVAYGSSRADTLGICGDEGNGYGMVLAWSTLGDGVHRLRTRVDGKLIGDVEFDVVALDEPFLTGLDRSLVVDNFPAPGESVEVRWSEPDQNFIIVDYLD